MSILGLFGTAKGLLKVDDVSIDNNIFRLHYKLTVIILVACSLVITAKQFVGDPIACVNRSTIDTATVNLFCWTSSTYTIQDGQRIYHAYYQWVCFVLFFQAILFYVPRYLWKTWEGGRTRALLQHLHFPIVSNQEKKASRRLLVDYFESHLRTQNIYAIRFLICEMLNFVNVIAQWYLMNYFLDGQFYWYGLECLTYKDKRTIPRDEQDSPMNRLFPKKSNCHFKSGGSALESEIGSHLCVLPLNIVNEKIYAFFWFWFIALGVSSVLELVYRVTIFSIKETREYLLGSQCRFASRIHIKIITHRFKFGDWFVLYQLGKNMDPLVYKDLITDLAKGSFNKEFELA